MITLWKKKEKTDEDIAAEKIRAFAAEQLKMFEQRFKPLPRKTKHAEDKK